MPAATNASTHPFQTDDPRLHAIHEKVIANHSLDAADVAALYASKDILAIGWLANYARERKHGNITRFAVHEIAESNPDEYVVLGEDLGRVVSTIESLKRNAPNARVSAFTIDEISTHADAKEMISNLRQAGCDGLIGSGAEVFLPALRKRLWHHAGDAEQRALARELTLTAGLQVPLYIVQREASPEAQAAELISSRAHPAETFAALSFDPDATTNLNHPVTTGMQEMKQIAIARLALDNVEHIRAYGQMLGSKLLQIALRFGASDLDGTQLDGGNLGERKKELEREIRVAGREAQLSPSKRKAVIHS
jgi:aminodeoxyfutalosine synthase